MFADVIVDISHEKLDKTFQYRIPPEMEDRLQVGMTVKVPFGSGNRQIKGYVTGISPKADFQEDRIKELLEIDGKIETIESKMIALAGWIRQQYGSTMNQALKTVLPVKAKVRKKEERQVVLDIPRDQAVKYFEESMAKQYHARARIIAALLDKGAIDYSWALKELHITGASFKPLIAQGILHIESNRIYRGTGENITSDIGQRQTPNEEQSQVIQGILDEWHGKKRPCLIRGVTGSGKTLVYMELIQHILEQGRQAIVLIPEIALTYQTVSRFRRYFGNEVAVLNSKMSQGERYDQMEMAREGRVKVMVGPRSALFTPFPNLGLIVIDEEQESTYKSENMPRYHAREVAIQRGKTEGAAVVMGSATPSVDVAYQVEQGNYAGFTLMRRYEDRGLPKVQVVDMRQELKKGNRSILSSRLEQAMKERLEKGEQIMLFLNRRGYAGFISCRSCGYVAKCPHCDVSMSIHNNGKLVCHYCGYEQLAYKECPSCASPYIGGFKAGTQQIEELVKKSFPGCRVLRMDYDTTRNKEGYARILDAFGKREADVLIGTQMIVKGHDFPKVTLVGVVAADLSLNTSDFRSGERTFQLLTQAVGRSGRGETPGEAIIQTYQPDHYSIQGAISQDYQEFYQEEMSYREMMHYPPAAELMAVYGGGENRQLLEQAMNYLKEYLLRLDKNRQLQIIGPAPQSIGKVQDIYRWVLYVKHKDRNILNLLRDRMEDYIEINKGFRNITIQYDFHV